MADACCSSFGGHITLEVGERKLVARGEISLSPSSITVEGGSNQDGSDYFTSKPAQVGWEATLQTPCDFDLLELMRRCATNATIVEADNDRSHLFTGGRLVGEPKVNLATGEVEGLMYRGGKYRRI